MNHSLLPTTHDATLPAKYEAAKIAILECSQIDECKDWADKAQALASYARQSEDLEMEKTAVRIRARAIRRCGELLKMIEKAQGKRTDLQLKGGASPRLLTRKTAANEAGLSPDQAKQSIRVASRLPSSRHHSTKARRKRHQRDDMRGMVPQANFPKFTR